MVVFACDLGKPRQDPVPGPQSGPGGAGNDQHKGLYPFTVPFQRLGKEIPVRVRGLDQQYSDWRQLIRVAVALVAFLQMTLGLQLLQ